MLHPFPPNHVPLTAIELDLVNQSVQKELAGAKNGSPKSPLFHYMSKGMPHSATELLAMLDSTAEAFPENIRVQEIRNIFHTRLEAVTGKKSE